jgi:hypothetical protein
MPSLLLIDAPQYSEFTTENLAENNQFEAD